MKALWGRNVFDAPETSSGWKTKLLLHKNTREIEFHLARGGRWPKAEK